MTAPAAVSRPVLYLVPGMGSRRPARSAGPPADPPPGRREPLAGVAAEYAARVLGTVFAPVATRVAEGLTLRAPLLVRRSRPEVWAAATAFLLAEESRLFDYDCCVTRTSLARELGCTLPTLRRRAAEIRAALDPWQVAIPAVDDS